MANKENQMQDDLIFCLQKKKRILQLQLDEKYKELKKLCIAEAELTGILPTETPLGPKGTPPKFRAPIGATYPYTNDILATLTEKKISPVKNRCPLTLPCCASSTIKVHSPNSFTKNGTWPAQKPSPVKRKLFFSFHSSTGHKKSKP